MRRGKAEDGDKTKEKTIPVTVAACSCGWIRTFEQAWDADRAALTHRLGHKRDHRTVQPSGPALSLVEVRR